MRRPGFIRATNAPEPRVRAGRKARLGSAALLGSNHPLVGASEALERLLRQSLAVAGVLAGSAIALTDGADWAPALVASAASVLVVLMVFAALAEQRKRDAARDLIIEGRHNLPVAAVQTEVRRLVAHRRRAAVARSLEAMVSEATSPPTVPLFGVHAFFDRQVVAAVAGELRAVARLLRADHAPAPGVALAYRLLTDGGSALYGHEVNTLQLQLRRVRLLLLVDE